MFHLKDNFGRGPISQVSAAWFNSVARFVNGLVGGFGIKLDKRDGLSVISVDPDAIKNLLTSTETGTGTPDDRTDANADDDTDGEEWTWTAGGENGLKMDVYCEVAKEDGWHYLQRCRLTFSKGGLLMKAERLPGRREIQG